MKTIPDSEIYLYNNVPFDISQTHTILFPNETAQRNYFTSLNPAVYSSVSYSYLRQEQAIKISSSIDELINCNYLAYNNKSFENKWFYAFITRVEYVAINVTRIFFKLDVLQTFMFDWRFIPTYIERNTVQNDAYGANLVTEPAFEMGQYVFDRTYYSPSAAGDIIVIAATFDGNYNGATGYETNKIYNGLYFNGFTTDFAANDFINGAVEKGLAEGIVSIFMFPTTYISSNVIENQVQVENKENRIATTSYYVPLDGYTPKNNKMYSWPYSFIYVTNFEGDSREYRAEYFDTSNDGFFKFDLMPSLSCNPEIICVPENYKKLVLNFNEVVSVGNFPQCSYNTDLFKAYIAQSAVKTASGALAAATTATSGVSAATNIFDKIGNWLNSTFGSGNIPQQNTAGAFNQGAGVIYPAAGAALKDYRSEIMGDIAAVYPRDILGLQAHGQTSAQPLWSNGAKGFTMFRANVNAQHAKIIDDFFSMYGYAIHSIQTINLNNRQIWDYIKTRGIIIEGDIISTYKEEIQNIFNNGITFWHDVNNFGNYALNNPPI